MFNLNKRIIKQALDLSPSATLIVDLKTHPQPVVYVNQAFEAVTGLEAGQLIGRPWSELLDDDEQEVTASGDHIVLSCDPELGTAEELTLEMLPLYDQPGKPRYWMGTESQLAAATSGHDESEREALLAVLRDAKMHLKRLDGRDNSTGVLSQRAFDDLLHRDWLMARREKRSLALIMFRLEAFDAYCSVYGRHAGDSCLTKVAHAITGSLRRASDLVGRVSDDQFAVLLSSDDEAKVEQLAERISAKVRELSIHHPRSDSDRFVTVSWGTAVAVPAGSDQAETLLDAASGKLGNNSAVNPALTAV